MFNFFGHGDGSSVNTPSHGSVGSMSSALSRQEAQRSESPALSRRGSAATPGSVRSSRESSIMMKPPADKMGRVKVGIRCRPAFQSEIDLAGSKFLPIIDTYEENSTDDGFGRVSLTLISGKQRDFMFDYVFGQQASQEDLFQRIAKPVVNDVLKGFNGTIFAYGQTGTGKTYTMGILESVQDEHAGIIPRAIAQIFEYVQSEQIANGNIETKITLSFLQIYRETIQDLLASANQRYSEDNLVIREDPHRGFYVAGLQEFIVRDYSEAEALLNLGLENRALASTLMNATSSRSHTVLTLHIEQHGLLSENSKSKKNVRSKLLMVDLAGSERVRRTVSKGTRLDEARSINTSLSALGNVIAALAQEQVTHVPYRDSKLTRLLQDSLGGTASTALIATVGPAAVNYAETLSTLSFAARCMAVKTTMVTHEEVDYADMCVKLQEKISTLESQLTLKHMHAQQRYESTIAELTLKLEQSENKHNSNKNRSFEEGREQRGDDPLSNDGIASLESVLEYLENIHEREGNRSKSGKPSWLDKMLRKNAANNDLMPLVAYSFEMLKAVNDDMYSILLENHNREERRRIAMIDEFRDKAEKECVVEMEQQVLMSHDPWVMEQARNKASWKDTTSNDDEEGEFKIGDHLAKLSHLEALTRVEGLHRNNNDPLSSEDRHVTEPQSVGDVDLIKDNILKYSSPHELAYALSTLHANILHNASSLNKLMSRKDDHYKRVKDRLAIQMVEGRKREEEVLNWSMILKYLLASTSKLRSRLKQEVEYNRDIAQSVDGGHGVVVKGGIPSFSATGGEEVGGGNGIYEVKDAKYREKESQNDDYSDEEEQNIEKEMDPSAASLTPQPEEKKRSSSFFSPLERVRARMNQIKNFGLRVTGRRSNERDKVNDTNQASAAEAQAELEKIHHDGNYDEEEQSPRGRGKRPSRYGRDNFGSSSEPVLEEHHLRHSTAKNTGRRPVPALDPSDRSKSPIRSPRKGGGVNDSMASNHSNFAQSVVTELGVQGEDAQAAAAIIDRVSKITAEQLALMDTQTRAQVLRVRHDLKLGPLPTEPASSYDASSRQGGTSNYNQYRRDDDDYYNYSDDD